MPGIIPRVCRLCLYINNLFVSKDIFYKSNYMYENISPQIGSYAPKMVDYKATESVDFKNLW